MATIPTPGLPQPPAPPALGQTNPSPVNFNPANEMPAVPNRAALTSEAQNPAAPIKMMNPSGEVGDVNPDKVLAAKNAGYEPAVQMINPNGETGWVRQSKTQAAQQAGYKTASAGYLTPEQKQAASDITSQEVGSTLPGGELEMGAVKGALKTADTVYRFFHSGPQSDAEKSLTTPSGAAEQVGNFGENLLEFIAGDEALKSASMAEKFGVATKIAKFAEDAPAWVQKALTIGMNSLRTGIVGTAQGTLKTGSATEGLKEGATTGATAGLLEGALARPGEQVTASQVAGKLLDATKNAPEDELTIAQKAKALVSKKAAAQVAQPATKGAVRGAAGNVAEAAGVESPSSLSAANSVEDVADSIYGKSKALYKQIDSATGGKFSGNEQQIKNIDKEIRMASTDEELGSLQTERAKLVQQQNDLFDQAQANGVDAKTVDAAKASYKQSQALYDLDKQIKMSTKGVPSDIAEEGSEPETIDPVKLSDRVNKMFRSGRLQEALGDEGAKEFVNKVSQAAKSHNAAISLAKLIQRVGTLAAIYGGIHYAGHVVGHMVGE
jgi:hypothetical protein